MCVTGCTFLNKIFWNLESTGYYQNDMYQAAAKDEKLAKWLLYLSMWRYDYSLQVTIAFELKVEDVDTFGSSRVNVFRFALDQ